MLASAGCGDSGEKEWEQSTENHKLDTYFSLIKESLLLEEELGKDTPYISMLRTTKGNTITGGMSKADAVEEAEYWIILEQAVFWYAEKNGILPTDKEIAEYLNNTIIAEAKEDEGFAQMEKMCNENNLTFADTVWAYENSYRWQYIMEKVSPEYKPELLDGIIADYKETSDYEEVLAIVKNCSNLITAGETEIEVLRKSDIFFQ